MKKILVTRRLLKESEDKASNMFEAKLNSNDELYSQAKVIEMSEGCDAVLTSLTDKMDEETINKLPKTIKVISNLVECISWAEKEVKKHGLIAPMVGHVGDGNFHSIILFDPNDKEKQKKIRKYSDDLIAKALELEGTITGEHGIGLQKKKYLLKEHPDNIPVMKSIKRSLDINHIMNPGKVFDLN